MIPVPQSRLDVLDPLLENAIKETNLTGRSSVSHIKANLVRGYNMRCAGAYVDDLEDPTVCLLISNVKGIMTEESIAAVHLVYAIPEARGNKDTLTLLSQVIDSYAKLTGCNTIYGSSWVYLGAKPCDNFWKKQGFVLQERMYVKKI